MGLRIKSSSLVADRERLIWRLYLEVRALGYRPEKMRGRPGPNRDQGYIYDVVAARVGVSPAMVLNVIAMTSPVGCFD